MTEGKPNTGPFVTGRGLSRVCEDDVHARDMHTAEAHGVISAELVRLTLGGRGPSRPELRMDFVGALARAAQDMARLLTDFAPTFRKVSRLMEQPLPDADAVTYPVVRGDD